jgi:diguanylate cyclase (GGDEF)-like protein
VDLVAAERTSDQVEHLLATLHGRGAPGAGRRWVEAVEELLPRAGDYDRARLLQARALVRGDGDAAGRVVDVVADALAAGELFERLGEPLVAATSYATAATAAVRAGQIGPALETAVRALVASEAATEASGGDAGVDNPGAGEIVQVARVGDRNPAVEAQLATMLGVLCQHFFDYPRALRCYRAAASRPEAAREDDPAHWQALRNIAEVLLAQNRDAEDGDPDAPGRLAEAEQLARNMIADGVPEVVRRVDGPRLLAAVLCARGQGRRAWSVLQDARRHALALAPSRRHAGRLGALRLVTSECHRRLGRPAEAVLELDAALALLDLESQLATRIHALRERSLARQEAGDTDGALADARELADLVWSRHRRQVGGFMDQLWSRAGAEGERRDLEARARELVRRAEQDPLTGLANRRAVERFCAGLDGRGGVCLVLVDVDDFKGVNDRFGHATGDDVLRAVSGLLTRSVRGKDVVARWGGEEFLVALPGGSGGLGSDAAARVCRRVRENDWDRLAPGLRVTVSVGVASGPVRELDAVLARADAAMYVAKRSGRDRTVVG